MRLVSYLIATFFFIGVQSNLYAQYMMQNALVTDCEGTLSDSNEGPGEDQYDHSEDFTFTICVEGASAITAIFEFFATEDTYDVLAVYDGPDINSPLIAELSGVLTNPPTLVATSGCMTFHFVSDDNILAKGWFLEWMVEVDEFADPDLTIDSPLDCPLGSLDVTVDPRIPCEIISPENFQLLGPDGAGISNAIALDCDVDSTASMFTLVFDDSLSIAGNYQIIFDGYLVNSCNDTLYLESLLSFQLSDCPFDVEIVVVEQACLGDCGELEVEIYSSDIGPYEISWSHTFIDSEVVEICSDTTILVTVSVENVNTGTTDSDQYLYSSLPEPKILNPFMSDTFCSTYGEHTYNVDIPGGLWTSDIMNNDADRRYRFWRWSGSTGLQQDFITYTDPNGCVTYDTVLVIPIDAGLDQSVCIGQDQLQLTGNNTNDGSWQGPNTTTDGIFTTTVADTFEVSFINNEGCEDFKRVFVIDSIEFIEIDTICSNQRVDLSNYVNSLGGTWSGPGIGNWYLGRLRAWKANINAWNTYYYEVEGCIDSLEIYVQGIWAGPDQTICLETDVIQLNKTGEWIGPGVYSPLDSTYDVSTLGPGKYDVRLRQGGCQDDFKLTIYDVYLDLNGPDIYCYNTGLIPLRDVVTSNPKDGLFSGEGVVQNAGDLFFDPSLVTGTVTHIYFETLGCIDSVVINIEKALALDDYVFCEIGSLQNLDNQGNSGYWEGQGVLIPETGLINPAELTVGNNEVYFITEFGCVNPVSIELLAFAEAVIDNIEDSYCFQDTNYIVDLSPAAGTFMIDGNVSAPQINPSELGFGNHELEYIVGFGECEDRQSVYIAVSAAISGDAYALRDTLCPNESTSIFVDTQGGADDIVAIWSPGLGFGKSHFISPAQSTTYNVTLSDGCSDDFNISLGIHVIDTFDVPVSYGPEVCYGDSSFIDLNLDDPSEYEITWDGELSPNGNILEELPGSYFVNIINQETGCQQNYTLEVPGAGPLGAGFNYTPNQECIDLINNEISVVDLAFGFTEGYMNFGINEDQVDILTDDLVYEYNNIGTFAITQVVANELGCTDTLVREICVENVVKVYVPNIFTPDGDGINDLFAVYGIGITNFSMRIYDRWGTQLYSSDNIEGSWDGIHLGQRVQAGVYSVVIQYENLETGRASTEFFPLTVVR